MKFLIWDKAFVSLCTTLPYLKKVVLAYYAELKADLADTLVTCFPMAPRVAGSIPAHTAIF